MEKSMKDSAFPPFEEGKRCENSYALRKASPVVQGMGKFMPPKIGGRGNATKHSLDFRHATSPPPGII